jgi:SAM-dependent methyltransferase
MAIGPIHLAWLKRVAQSGVFRGSKSVIDLGPQDIQISRPILAQAMRTVTPADRLAGLLAAIFDGESVRFTAQRDFYALFGLQEYASLDAQDERADYKLDLNVPVSDLPEFDVVTNFGTTEHVFNVGEAFKTIHELTRPGGVSLHAIPSFAFINHGFYNVHPNAIIEMARANGYELLNFSYVDNTFWRNQLLAAKGVDAIDFAALPIRLEDMENSQTFMAKVVATFYRNLTARETRKAISDLGELTGSGDSGSYPSGRFQIGYVFDLIFVALRRPQTRQPFVMPMQDPAGVRPLPRGSRGAESVQ